MKKIKNRLLNYHPTKPLLFLYFFIPIITVIFRAIVLDNDIWFLLNTGKYIIKNGFPIIEPFTIHENMHFCVQQWLSSIIFFIIYDLFNGWGLFIFTIILFIIIIFITYKLCMLISREKSSLSVLITCLISYLYSLIFIRSRPQIFDYIIFLSLFYLLESYIRKKNTKYLYILPILSILLINLHASVWFLLFLFMLPYIINSFKFNILCFESESYNKSPLLIITFIMFCVGFINPYGIDAITYIFLSYNSYYINMIVNEMKPPLITSLNGMVIYSSIFLVFFAILYNKNKKVKIRYFLLFLGCAFLSFCNLKSFSYFITASIFGLSDIYSEFFRKSIKKTYSRSFKIQYTLYLILFFLLCVLVTLNSYKDFEKSNLSKIVDYLEKKEKIDKKTSKIYTMYDDGGYVEYRGYKAYIDPRAEVFLKTLNKKEDIFKEYFKVQTGEKDILEFLEKYNFDYLIVYKKDYIYRHFLNSEENIMYKKIYTSKNRFLYKKIK